MTRDKRTSITWNDFEKIEVRVGTIIDVQNFPEAKITIEKFQDFFSLLENFFAKILNSDTISLA